jgi:hypothetical protein
MYNIFEKYVTEEKIFDKSQGGGQSASDLKTTTQT